MSRFVLGRQQLRSPLARRLIVAIILVSSAITLLITTFQLHDEYRGQLKEIRAGFKQIEEVHLKSLVQSLWNTNERNLRLQLEGLVRVPHLEHASVRQGDKVWAEAGRRVSRDTIEHQYPMTYQYGGKTLEIGVLTVVAGLDAIYQGLASRAFNILTRNALKTFLVAAFAFAFFHWLVNRHLIAISAYLRGLEPSARAAPLALSRAAGRRPDELDEVCDSINAMREKVGSTLATLEQRVAERTFELEAAIVRAESSGRLKSAFLATMSHELRTPLNAIIGFTGTLLMKLPGPLNAEQAKQLTAVQTSGRHLLSLINDLLDLAKIESGKVELVPEPVPCRAVLAEVEATLG